MSRTRILLGFLIGFPLAGGIALGADAWQRVQDDTLETTTDPSRVFSAPTRIEVGAVLAPGELVALFDAMGYRAGNGEEIGTYRVGGHEVSAGLRSRHALTVAFAGSTVSAILVDERPKPA